MKKLIIITLFLIAGKTYAQVDYQINSALDFIRANKISSGEYNNTISEKDIQGSPYLNDDFIIGTVYTIDKFQYNDIPLRYNIFNDNVEFKTPGNKILAIAAPETIEKITFGDYTMEYIAYVNVKKERNGYMLLITKGKASLYIKPEVTYLKPSEAKAYEDPKPAKFERNSDAYFIRIDSETARRINKKKDLLETFPDYQSEIETFIKKNKTSANKTDDLKLLVDFYNSL